MGDFEKSAKGKKIAGNSAVGKSVAGNGVVENSGAEECNLGKSVFKTYCLGEGAESFDLENLLNTFGLEKLKGEGALSAADLVVAVDGDFLTISSKCKGGSKAVSKAGCQLGFEGGSKAASKGECESECEAASKGGSKAESKVECRLECEGASKAECPLGFEAVSKAVCGKEGGSEGGCGFFFSVRADLEKDELKRRLYRCLDERVGHATDWGILTGVRPVKLAAQLLMEGLSGEAAVARLEEEYLISRKKAELIVEIAEFEISVVDEKKARPCGERGAGISICDGERARVCACDGEAVGAGAGDGEAWGTDRLSLYVSIPFCPTRCRYCSFPMQPLSKKAKLLPLYFEKLLVELDALLGANLGEIDCIYVGGGTPSVLSPQQIDRLGEVLWRHLDRSKVREFTFEAGRTDTIDSELLEALGRLGVDRVSVNAQSFTPRVLDYARRSREAGEFERSFGLVRDAGFAINTDLILGLPLESKEEFLEGVRHLVELGPENITVHALALKRGSALFGEAVEASRGAETDECGKSVRGNEFDGCYKSVRGNESDGCYKSVRSAGAALGGKAAQGAGAVCDVEMTPGVEVPMGRSVYAEMSEESEALLRAAGYAPYYLYRQKRIIANLENVGYAKKGAECLYNSRIMSERATILAAGTGGVSKICFPEENRHEQVPGTRSVEDYIDNFDKVMARLEKIKRLLK